MNNEAFAKLVFTWEREEQNGKPEGKKVAITRFEKKKNPELYGWVT